LFQECDLFLVLDSLLTKLLSSLGLGSLFSFSTHLNSILLLGIDWSLVGGNLGLVLKEVEWLLLLGISWLLSWGSLCLGGNLRSVSKVILLNKLNMSLLGSSVSLGLSIINSLLKLISWLWSKYLIILSGSHW
jgi:hypothetical protein